MEIINLRVNALKQAAKSIFPACLLAFGTALPSQAIEKINLVSFEDPPYVFTQNKVKSGLTINYIDELMWRSNIDYQLTIMPPKRALLHTLESPNTCVFPIERSQEREVKYTWISPITISRYAFYKSPKKDLPAIRALNDANSFRIGSYLGSAIGEYLSSLGFTVDYASNNKANILKLNAGRIDLWAADTLNAQFIAKQAKRKLLAPELIFFTTVKAIGCHPDIDKKVVNALNQNLNMMYQDGTIEKIRASFKDSM